MLGYGCRSLRYHFADDVYLRGLRYRRPSPLPMKNRLKVLRAERDWTQADLAERLEVSRQTVNALEKGKYDPSLPLAFKIAHIFSEPIEAIFIYETE